MATIRLTWVVVLGAVSYNIYHNTTSGLSTTFSPLLTNTSQLTFDHTGLSSGGNHYYIVAAVGPNNEIGPPTYEILIQT